MKHRIKAVDRETGETKFGMVEADTPEDALKRVNQKKYVVTIAEPEPPQSNDGGVEWEEPTAGTARPPAPPTRPQQPAGETKGYAGLPAWVATEKSMKGAGKTIATFVIVGVLLIGGLVFAEMANRGQITVGHVITFGVGFVVVSMTLIGWKLSTIAKSLQDDRRP